MFVAIGRTTRRSVTVAFSKRSNCLSVYRRSEDVEKLLKIKKDLGSTRTPLLPINATPLVLQQVVDILSSKDVGFEVCALLGEVMKKMIRQQSYCPTSFDLLASTLKSTSNEYVLQLVLPAFLGLCAKVRYYDPSLLNFAGSYAVDNMNSLSQPNLVGFVYSMAKFDHSYPTLFSKLEKYLLAGDTYLNARHLAWTLLWGGMIHAEYPKDLMCLMLQDSYIQGNLVYDAKFVLTILLQLKISLNTECLDLKLGTGWDSCEDLRSWGSCRSGIKGVSTDIMKLAYLFRISDKFNPSVLDTDILRAFQLYLNDEGCIQSNSLSLAGYSFDFEILLDSNGDPISLPMRDKSNSNIRLLASIGAGRDVQLSWQQIKYDAGILGENMDVTTGYAHSVNIASDWRYKFGSYPSNVSRKVVIEADGPIHYARNCKRSMGSTKLKERHIRSLGWELVTIRNSDWTKIKKDFGETSFIHSIIHPNK